MRIGITCYPTYGGSGVVATELGIELAERGHQVHFITYSQPIRLTEPHANIHYHEVEVSRYPLFEYPPYDLALATRMAEVAEIYDLDLLHVHYAIPHSVSAMLARQMLACGSGRKRRRLPYVTTLHGTDITLVGLDSSYLPITRFSIEQSNGVTAISDYLKQQTLEQFNIENHIEVIPNFVNCDLYRRDPNSVLRRSEYARPDERVLVHLSNFRPVKRVTDVIEVFDRVLKKASGKAADDWRRTRPFPGGVAGDEERNPQAGSLPRQAEWVNEKLAVADVMLLPSELESFGLAALEAMACEVVPISTNAGGVPELIDHGINGYMVDVGDVDAMARHAIEVLSDDTELRDMGKRARAKAQKRFCSTMIIPHYEQFYREVLERMS